MRCLIALSTSWSIPTTRVPQAPSCPPRGWSGAGVGVGILRGYHNVSRSQRIKNLIVRKYEASTLIQHFGLIGCTYVLWISRFLTCSYFSLLPRTKFENLWLKNLKKTTYANSSPCVRKEPVTKLFDIAQQHFLNIIFAKARGCDSAKKVNKKVS